jgi:peptidoglycan hydrolase-like protein with peptidoglycan-binding domain
MAILAKRFCIVIVFALIANSASGTEVKPDAVNSAEPSPKALSNEKATPFGIRLQVLLDRAHFSPGEIDGKFGENARKALRAYEESQQLPSSDTVTAEVWKTLVVDDRSVLAEYMITEKDVSGPFL